jgi:membrane protein insertase Oxa1/YidC/SpoIIIJ
MVLLSFMPRYLVLSLIENSHAICRLYYLRRKIFNSLTSLSRAFSASYCTAVVAITLFMLLMLLPPQKQVKSRDMRSLKMRIDDDPWHTWFYDASTAAKEQNSLLNT